MAFVSRAAHVTISGSRQAQRIVFTKQFQDPCTICTQEPITAPGRHAFEVAMPVKDGHVALGWVTDPADTAYMTPDFRSDKSPYLSMGGAGFVYPQRQHSGGSYGLEDTVRSELELDAQGNGVVRWHVNGKPTGEAPWTHGTPVFPAISCKQGEVVCVVSIP